jgi:hypothetical protein
MATTVTRPYSDAVYITPLPATLHQLHALITDSIAYVDAHMLRQIWDEIGLLVGGLPSDTKPHRAFVTKT